MLQSVAQWVKKLDPNRETTVHGDFVHEMSVNWGTIEFYFDRAFDVIDHDPGHREVRYNKHLAAQFLPASPSAQTTQLSLIHHWLRTCDAHHSCYKRLRSRPTRLLEIAAHASEPLQLHPTASLPPAAHREPYAALSHRWGSPTPAAKAQFCTTDANLARRRRGFALEELPQTFRDAVRVARALGLRFLWIDALCINQSNPEAPDSDWRREAERMDDVFRGAYVTIAATAAEGWEGGFLGSVLKEGWCSGLEFEGSGAGGGGDWTRLDDRHDWFAGDVDGGALNQRAWVLQERVLSRRIVHFTREHVYWECGHSVLRDDFWELRCGKGKDYFLHDPNFPARLRRAGHSRALDFTLFLCRRYARTGITEPSDREVAIASLVKRLTTVWRCECRFGIFNLYFHRMLLWRGLDDGGGGGRAGREVTSAEDELVPTWSWMTTARIDFTPASRIRVPPLTDLRFDPAETRALLVKLRVLTACGFRWAEGRVEVDFVDAEANLVGHGWIDQSRSGAHVGSHVVIIALDTSDRSRDVAPGERSFYVLLVTERLGNEGYRRIGVATIRAKCVSEKWHASRLF